MTFDHLLAALASENPSEADHAALTLGLWVEISVAAPTDDLRSTRQLLEELLEGEAPLLTDEQVGEFVTRISTQVGARQEVSARFLWALKKSRDPTIAVLLEQKLPHWLTHAPDVAYEAVSALAALDATDAANGALRHAALHASDDTRELAQHVLRNRGL